MGKDIKQLIADYRAYTEEHPKDTRADLFLEEIQEICDLSRMKGGKVDAVFAVINAYAVGYMNAAKRYGKDF